MTDLLKLAERCEQATGPDRDLDAKISRAVGGYSETKSAYQPEPFTASLDAAMTLVPEEMIWSVESYSSSAEAEVRFAFYTGHFVRAATPALALCAAALRARKFAFDDTPKG